MEPCTDIETGRLIHAYEIGVLSEDEQERFEIHLLECNHCFEEVRSFEDAATLLREDPGVRAVLLEETAEPEPATREPFLRTIWRYLWPDAPLVFRPALIYTILLLAILPASLLIRTGGELPGVRPVEAIGLFPLRSGEEQVLHRSSGAEGMIRFICRGAIPGKPYRVVVSTEQDDIIYQEETFDRFDEDQTGWLLLPLTHLKSGSYRLEISNPADPQSQPQVYTFSIAD